VNVAEFLHRLWILRAVMDGGGWGRGKKENPHPEKHRVRHPAGWGAMLVLAWFLAVFSLRLRRQLPIKFS
jgi:hypothetical protein